MTETVTPEQYKAMVANKKRARKRRPPPVYIPGQHFEHLLARPKLPWSMTLGPEDRLSVLFADCMSRLTIAGLFIGDFLHVPNEGKRHEFVLKLLMRMGLIHGAPDFFFGWNGGSGRIEFKVKPNSLNSYQKYYRDWCLERKINWACVVAESDAYDHRVAAVHDAIATLHRWGAIACSLDDAYRACEPDVAWNSPRVKQTYPALKETP